MAEPNDQNQSIRFNGKKLYRSVAEPASLRKSWSLRWRITTISPDLSGGQNKKHTGFSKKLELNKPHFMTEKLGLAPRAKKGGSISSNNNREDRTPLGAGSGIPGWPRVKQGCGGAYWRWQVDKGEMLRHPEKGTCHLRKG